MSIMLRICLVAASAATMALMMQKIRKSRVRIEDSIYWLFFSAILIVFSVFPKTAYILSDLVGTEAPSNFIFLLIIFLLLLKVFSLSVRLSQLETKVKELAQRMALERLEEEKASRSGGEDTPQAVQHRKRIKRNGSGLPE